MRSIVMLAIAVVMGAGLGISYLIYRQLDTSTVALEASPQFERNEQGVLCGEVDFVVEARSLGRWLLPVEKAQTISGVVAVDGGQHLDIGFRILSPNNRLVLFHSERAQRHEFEVARTIRGDYQFEFDNRHSTLTEKQLTVSICLT